MSDLVERLRTGKTDGTDLRWTVTQVHREAADEIARLRALNAELVEALEPFAFEADNWVEMGDTRPVISLPMFDSGGPTVGHLRRARTALSRAKGEA